VYIRKIKFSYRQLGLLRVFELARVKLLLLLLLRLWWRTLSHSQSEESQVRVLTRVKSD